MQGVRRQLSAAQFLQRNALFSPLQTACVQRVYAIANPSSYCYLTAERALTLAPYTFGVPPTPNCTYNRYRYGFEALPYSYLTSTPQATLGTRSFT